MGVLWCQIEMSKERGVTVTVKNEDATITQTIHMDGTQIETKVTDGTDTSTITQIAAKIHVKVKDFVIDADTITCTSTKDTKHEAKQKMSILSTQDMLLDSKAKLDEKAVQDVTIEGMNITAKAKTKATVEGPMGVDVKAAGGNLNGTALAVKLSGTATAEMAAPMAKVNGTGTASLESGGIAKIQGSMVTVGGGLIKLG